MKNLFFTLLAAFTLNASAQWKANTPPSNFFPTLGLSSIDGKLYAATNKGLYVSDDNGDNWTMLHEGATFKQIIQINGDTLLATYHGSSLVMRSDNKGTTWNMDTVGIDGKGENKALMYDAAGNRIFISLGYPSYGLYYKSPSEASWNRVSSVNIGTSAATNVSHIAMKGNKIFAAGYSYFYTSVDGGMNWVQETTTGYPSAVGGSYSHQAFVAADAGIFMGGDGGIYKSIDEGLNWSKIGNGIINHFFGNPFASTMYYDGTTLYVGARGHNDSNFVYTSTDGGANFQIYADRIFNFPVAITKHKGALVMARFSKDSVYNDGNFSTTGIVKLNEVDFNLYPNPVQSELTVQNNTKGFALTTYTLVSLTGQLILEEEATKSEVILNVSDLPQGAYFLHISNTDGIQVRKVIVAR
ncbi:MAG: T9SS type A sorting domain-containing protein [Bacteroidia bacterium]